MKILITNDDGIYANGLLSLYKTLSKEHSATIVAPDRERSAVGQGITLHKPLRVFRVKINGGVSGYAVSGTPTDCIKLGILELLDHKPDIVLSGINSGANVGVNVNYSGTVAAAKEAALYGIPAIAVSINNEKPECYDEAARFINKLAEKVFKNSLTFGTMLNVNLPDLPLEKIAGIRISRQGISLYSEYIEKKTDPRNRTYYWHGANGTTNNKDSEVDDSALAENYISITPIKCDTTDYNMIENLKQWGINGLRD